MGFGNLEARRATRLENLSCYCGEWREGTMIREGRGFYVYADGSLYEGYWKNDHATYYGRLIRPDGEVY